MHRIPLTITVTRAHINAAEQARRERRSASLTCPIAQAVCDIFPLATKVKVTDDRVIVSHPDWTHDREWSHTTQSRAYLKGFDDQRPVAPQTLVNLAEVTS